MSVCRTCYVTLATSAVSMANIKLEDPRVGKVNHVEWSNMLHPFQFLDSEGRFMYFQIRFPT